MRALCTRHRLFSTLRGDGALGCVWRIETLETVSSTQDIVKKRAVDGHAEGLTVRALAQSAGQGRHGRQWISENGNLYVSLLLRPECAARDAGQLAILTGLAVAKAAGRFISGRGLALKWPNDLLLDGMKCGGILLESGLFPDGRVDWIVAGIGINTAHAPEGAAALGCDANGFLAALLEEFDALYRGWKNDGFEPARRGWLSLAHRPGDFVSVKIGPQFQSGTFHSIDGFGNLILRDADLRLKTITAGDVYPARS